MTEQEKLNRAVKQYQAGSQMDFREVYEALTPMRRAWLAKASGSYLDDRHTREATFDDTFMRSIDAYDPDRDRSFTEYISGNLRRANASNVEKRNRKKLLCEVLDYCVDDDGTTRIGIEKDKGPTPEEFVQKKRDHRQVISFLLASSDELTVRIATHRPIYDSDNALAKELGIHHTVVQRRLEKLAARYDANRFGPISQYLA